MRNNGWSKEKAAVGVIGFVVAGWLTIWLLWAGAIVAKALGL